MPELAVFLVAAWNLFVVLVVLISIAVLQRKVKKLRATVDEHELRINGQEQILRRATDANRALQAEVQRLQSR